jgi:pimeloyl-ACP methyl ester carboxylesterase
MEIVDRGEGVPLVLIPGIQGRWEYMRPAIDRLARSFRVITFPLCGERASQRRFEPARGLDNFVDQIDEALDDRGLARAVMCGVSFGGLIALHFAARRGARTSALVLVSTPGPDFRPTRRHQMYARVPWLLGPVFLAGIPGRVRSEISLALPRRRDRRRFVWGQIRTFAGAPLSLPQMAARSTLLGSPDLTSDCARVVAPTLVISGEPSLDRVVPAGGSAEYVRLIPGARAARIERTGHLGYITRPDAFAGLVEHFVSAATAGREGPDTGPRPTIPLRNARRATGAPGSAGAKPPGSSSSHDDAA